MPPLALEGSPELADALEAYVAGLEAGRAPDRDALIAAYPGVAATLAECLSAIEFIHGARRSLGPPGGPPTRLGDFRIVREVGAGGMGVVYEAEQISLGRRVALKVLRFGPTGDAEAMKRFQREAETVARLHHTNIVPVYAIGEENGVHYFAMQFIDGENVADAAARLTAAGNPPDPRLVARWGLEAAEALAHAHERAVIHRDVKPSNLLLDRDGRVWLTDFGLARRLDDVSRSLSGVLLGTPRYMSPEQAAATRHPVDHRSDIYSLGATLYELVTGRPVFAADTPHAIIAQILAREPLPPRRVHRDLARDLETIILKCLAKNPARRYAGAGALARDLRAFMDDQPICARRPRPVERVARFVRKHRRSVAVAAAAAAITLLAVAVLVGGWSELRAGRQGRVLLKTGDRSLRVEIRDGQGELAVPAYRIPTEQAIAVPSGAYRVELSHPEYLSESWLLEVPRARSVTYEVQLSGRQLWDPLRWVLGGEQFELEPLRLEDHADLIGTASVVTEDRSRRRFLRRLDGATVRPVWDLPLDLDKGQPRERADALGHDRDSIGVLRQRDAVQLALEIDGDGVRDLVRGREGLAAVSGADGRLLWRSDLSVAGAPGRGRLLGAPVVLDRQGDGRQDIAVVTASADGTLSVLALAGDSGKTAWRHALEPVDGVAGAAEETSAPGLTAVSGPDGLLVTAGSRAIRLDRRTGAPELPALDLGGEPLWPPRVADLDSDGRLELISLHAVEGEEAGGLLVRAHSLDRRTLLWQHFLAASSSAVEDDQGRSNRSSPAPRWPLVADLEGDGRVEIAVPTRHREASSGGYALEVLDGPTGARRWIRWWFDAASRAERQTPTPAAGFRSELGEAARDDPGAGLMMLALLVGPDSAERTQLDRFVAGPDIDRDGTRDLFAAAFDGLSPRLFVTALSGADGTTLWWWRRSLRKARIGTLGWWQEGPDGLPLLVVPFDNEAARGSRSSINGVSTPNPPSATYFLVASTGRLAHTLPGIPEPQITELDGDGVPDLIGTRRMDDDRLYDSPSLADRDVDRKLQAFRGAPAEEWRRLGKLRPAADLDGDGLADLLGDGLAVSGRDGRVLWRHDENDRGGSALAPSPRGDLDGDGAPDLVDLGSPTMVAAHSGRSGEILWTAEVEAENWAAELLEGGADGLTLHGVGSGSDTPPSRLVDLDGDGHADLVRFYERFHSRDGSGETAVEEQRVVVVSGRDGSVRWRQTVAPDGYGLERLEPAIADLDGDGTQDLVTVVLGPGRRRELRALDGSDGRILWTHPLAKAISWSSGCPVLLLADDLDGEGRSEVVVLDRVEEAAGDGESEGLQRGEHIRLRDAFFRVQALEGIDGEVRWTWHGKRRGAHEIWDDAVVWGGRGDIACAGGIGRAVCLRLYANGIHGQRMREVVESVVIDSRGVKRHGAVRRLRGGYSGLRGAEWSEVLAHDVDGDGVDEVLWLDERSLLVSRGHPEEVLWQRKVSREDRPFRSWRAGVPEPLVEILESTGPCAPVLALRTSRGMLGLDGLTGKPLWRARSQRLLASTRPGELPRFLRDLPGGVACCFARAADGSDGSAMAAGGQGPSATAGLSLPAPDPRYARPLPWVEPGQLAFFTAATVDAFLFVALPFLLALWTLRWRSWKVGLLLVLAVGDLAAGRALDILPRTRHLGSRAEMDQAINHLLAFPVPFGPYLIGLPLVAAAGLLVGWGVRKRWRRIGGLLGGTAVLAALLAGWQLHRDTARKDALEFYVAAGWYLIVFRAAFLVGLVVLAVFVLRSVAAGSRWVWWRARTA